MILADTNIIVAALVLDHPHHAASRDIFALPEATLIVAAHSVAEAYSTLTRANRPFRIPGEDADRMLSTITIDASVVALSAPATLAAIRRFSAIGVGPRLYDYLIAATGVHFGATTLVTWNTRHFAGLFPRLRVVTPVEAVPPPP